MRERVWQVEDQRVAAISHTSRGGSAALCQLGSVGGTGVKGIISYPV